MGKEILKTPTAVDNVLTLESGIFYGITTNDGGTERTWGMNVVGGTNGKGVSSSVSERIYASKNGIALEEVGKWSKCKRYAKDAWLSAGNVYDYGRWGEEPILLQQ